LSCELSSHAIAAKNEEVCSLVGLHRLLALGFDLLAQVRIGVPMSLYFFLSFLFSIDVVVVVKVIVV